MELYFPHETIARVKPNSIAEEDSLRLNQTGERTEDEVHITGFSLWDSVFKDEAILDNARTCQETEVGKSTD